MSVEVEVDSLTESVIEAVTLASEHVYRASELVWAADELSGENVDTEEYENIDRMNKILTLAQGHFDAADSILTLTNTVLDAEAFFDQDGEEPVDEN